MRDIKEHLLTPIILFFVLLIDGQISTFLANILPLQWHLVSHFIFIFMLFVSINLSRNYNILLFCCLGLIYDVYYFHTIGIALILFPLLSLLICQSSSTMLLNKFTRFLSVLILVFLFELISFTFAVFLNLSSLNLQDFVLSSLVPTILLNGLIFLIFQPIFEKMYL